MQIIRNRLLVTLVLLAVACAAMPRTTFASSSVPSDESGGGVSLITDNSHPRPLLGPTNGEPDSPSKQTGTSSLNTFGSSSGGKRAVAGLRGWDLLRWISAMWAARFLRVGI